MRVILIRSGAHKNIERESKRNSEAPKVERRFINGSPGHHIALLNKLHQGITEIAQSPSDPKLYADHLQAFLDLAGLHLVSWEAIDESCRELLADGGYEVGTILIEGEDALEKARKGKRHADKRKVDS